MSADFRRRLAALEAQPSPRELPVAPQGFCIVGRGLVVPMPMPADAWERLCVDVMAAVQDLERCAIRDFP
jgi:hypothetical protein